MDEMNSAQYADPYANEAYMLEGDRLQRMNDEYGKDCFYMTVASDGTLQNQTSGDVTKRPDKCNDTSNVELTHYRFYLADLVVANQNACYEGDDDACKQLGFGGTPTAPQNTTPSDPSAVGDPYAPSDTMTCSVGTDGGVQDGYRNNVLIKIRICNVQGIQVNARIAANVDALLNAARGAGINFTGGGFRTMAGQIAARQANNCPNIYTAPASTCSPPTAIPGYSNHQMGLAIDFVANGGIIQKGSAGYNWLGANAAKYGLKNLPSEAWHWSVDGS
jgi:hypothetical protein